MPRPQPTEAVFLNVPFDDAYRPMFEAIAGQDIKAHRNKPEALIKAVRNWLRDTQSSRPMPSGGVIAARYRQFRKQLPVWCREQKLEEHELQFNDYTFLIWRWLEANE